MRWESRRNKRNRINKEVGTRIITKFLLFPKCIKGEVKWWERVRYSQSYFDGILGGLFANWLDEEWLLCLKDEEKDESNTES